MLKKKAKAPTVLKSRGEVENKLLQKYLSHLREDKLHDPSTEGDTQGSGLAQRCASKILATPGFDNCMGLLILTNLIVMIIEIDLTASEEEDSTEGGLHWTEAFGWAVLVLFILELLLRLVALQCSFWIDSWNISDFIIVFTDLGFSIMGLIFGSIFPVSILRIVRLSKLARVSKLLRVFPELKMLLVGLVRSLRATFWGTLLLFVFLLIWSMAGVLLIHPLNKEIDHGGCDRCSRAYSSVMQACLTIWQQVVTGDSWGVVTIPVIERYPITILFFIPTFLSIGLCVLNLMLAVVVSVSQMAYQEAEDEGEAEKVEEKAQHHNTILSLCNKMDTDKSGELSHEEITAGFRHSEEFHAEILALGITEEDIEIAWSVMDVDQSGTVSYKEFVTFLLSMKTSDEHFMLLYIKNYVSWIKQFLSKKVESENAKTLEMESKLQQTMEKVEADEDAAREDMDLMISNLERVGVEAQSSNNHDRLTPKVIDRDGTGNTDTCAGEEVMSASVRVAMADFMQQSRDDARRMYLDLKAILADMDRNICQRIPSAFVTI